MKMRIRVHGVRGGVHADVVSVNWLFYENLFSVNDRGELFNDSFVRLGVNGFHDLLYEYFRLHSFDDFLVMVVDDRLFVSFLDDDGLHLFNNSFTVVVNFPFDLSVAFLVDRLELFNVVNC